MPKEAPTLDKDLYDGLQQARKKKPRYFALIAKGPDVVGLIVQKKAISDGLAQKTKSESKGNLVIQGVCHGEGVELKFEVVGAEPSILPKKIKDFIDERTELALKAQWVVVTQLSAVPDEEAKPAVGSQPAAGSQPTQDPLAAFQVKVRDVGAVLGQLKDTNPFREGLAQRLQMEVALVGTAPANVPGGLKTLATIEQEAKGAAEFAMRAGAVYFAIEAISEQEPVRGQLLNAWNAEINAARNSGAMVSEFVPASLQRLAALEQQAKSKLPAQPAPQATSQQPVQEPVKPTATVDYKALLARLKALLIRQKDLFAKSPELREKLLAFSQPASTLTMRASPDAVAALDKLEQELNAADGGGQQPAAQQETPAVGNDPKQQQWEAEHARLEPRYLQVMGSNPPDGSKLRTIMIYATEQAEAGAYDKGLAALKRLEPMLNAVVGPAAGAAKTPETSQPAESKPTGAAKADELRKQLGELRMRMEHMVGDAPLDQLDQVIALKDKGETVAAGCFAQLDAGDLTKAAASIEALRNLLDGKPAASATAAAEPAAKQPEAVQPAAKRPEASSQPAASQPAASEPTAAVSADELRKQLAELRMRLEQMEGDAPLDQLAQVMALKEKAEPLAAGCFAQLDAGDLTKAAASIEALRNLLDGKPQASTPVETSAPATSDQAAFQKLQQEILPAYREALVARSDDDALKALMRTANTKAKTDNDFAGALAALAQLAKLLAQGEPPVANPEELEASYKKLHDELNDRMNAMLDSEVKHPQEGSLLEHWRNAAKKAGAKNLRGAMAELQKLAPMLAGAPSDIAGSESAAPQGGAFGELKARADKVWDAIEEIADANVRKTLLAEYRELEKVVPSPDEIATANLAEAEKLLAALEQQVAAAQSQGPAASPTTGPESAKPREPMLPIWTEAKEEVDAAIGKLQDALRAADDEDLHSIVEYGLYGATTGQAVKLMAALRDADQSGSPELLKKVSEAVEAFREFLDGAPIVDLIEDNDFKVQVPLRQVLGKALGELQRLATV